MNNSNNNNNVKCSICNQFVIITGINAHLDSNCENNVVQPDGTIKNLMEDRASSFMVSTLSSNSESYSNTGQNFIHLNSSSISKKKILPTLFNQLSPSSRKRNTDDKIITNTNINTNLFSPKNKKMSNFNSSLNSNIALGNINNGGYSYQSNKKLKIEYTGIKTRNSPKFDINKKYDNYSGNNSNTLNPMKRENKKQLPLAELVRPTSLEDFFGQEDLMGEGSILKTLIQENKVPSLIFWGPPGVGILLFIYYLYTNYSSVIF